MHDDAFQVHARLGSGTTGAVFRATRTADQVPVVIKVLHPELFPPSSFEDLRRAVDALQQVDHHAVASEVQVGTWRGDPVLVRPLIQGVDLATVVAGSAPPPRIALHIAAEVAGALDAVRSATGLGHGDLKPSNVFLDPTGDVVVVDFGLIPAHPERATQTLTILHGSVGFMSPERADNRRSDHSDTYSLALILAWMLTGEMPRRTSAHPARHAARCARLVERLQAVRAHPEAIEWIANCAAYEPEARPALADVARALARLAESVAGPSPQTWAGPLVSALLVQPHEVEITDTGQPLSATVPGPPARVVGADKTPAHQIRTRGQGGRRLDGRSRRLAAVGFAMLLLAVGMLAAAIAIAIRA